MSRKWKMKISFLFLILPMHTLTTWATLPGEDLDLLAQLPAKYRAEVEANLQSAGPNLHQWLGPIPSLSGEQREAYAYLLAHAPERDVKELKAPYFLQNVEWALKVRASTPWGKDIPEEIFLNNVLPYVNVTEKREDWRGDFYQRFFPKALKAGTIAKAVDKLNTYVFESLNVHYHATLRKFPDQSPSESVAIGWASCTGLSIILVDALRAVGIPARLAGISVWPETGGNHTWVEIWDQGWHYIGASEPGPYDQTWFSGMAAKADPSQPLSRIYAVSFARTGVSYPMVWNMGATYVSAVDVTMDYKKPRASASYSSNSSYSLSPSLSLLNTSPLNVVKEEIWNAYKEREKASSVRLKEHQDKAISYNGLTMRYTSEKIGDQPAAGYPLYIALHGGGGAPAWVNDGQWVDMQRYYKEGVKAGIYVAPRGVRDVWNLHSQDESYVMYDRLIENMILYENVDPNRVYILGFSAGGDGVYQIAPRMNDRFAAVNMSAGHPNGVGLLNVYQLPFLIQVGELDSAYNRNKVDAQYCVNLKKMHESEPAGFRFGCNIHAGRPHNFLDNQPQGLPQKVLADPEKWLTQNDASAVSRDTNAIHWLDQFKRNPLPERIIWDLTIRADRTGVDSQNNHFWKALNRGQQNYWLDVGHHTSTDLGVSEIVVHLNKQENAVVVEKAAPYLKVLLNEDMLDLSRPVLVQVGGQGLSVKVSPSREMMEKTLEGRGDYSYIFSAALVLERGADGAFTVKSEE